MFARQLNNIYPLFLSEKRKIEVERFFFFLAILAFILHLLLIALADFNIIPRNAKNAEALLNPITAIYTPFSVILLYEIYSLIYYLPKSITFYLGKQYEIIVLILVRRLFYDLSNISTGAEPFKLADIQGLLITFGSLILFCLLIFCFYKLSGDRSLRGDEQLCVDDTRKRYVMEKKIFALMLMLLYIFLLIKSLFVLRTLSFTAPDIVFLIKSMNEIFFDIFFTGLILIEVLLLLLTFNLTGRFYKIIRNSGFIISTILLKLSFKAEGITNLIIIFGAMAFGVAILGVYRLFEVKLTKRVINS